MQNLLFILAIFILAISCKKETNNVFEPYFRLKVDGKKESLGSCGFFAGGGGYSSCSINGDSILLISVGCDIKSGFFIKGNISNGTYQLDNKNQAWYEENSAKNTVQQLIKKEILLSKKGHFNRQV